MNDKFEPAEKAELRRNKDPSHSTDKISISKTPLFRVTTIAIEYATAVQKAKEPRNISTPCSYLKACKRSRKQSIALKNCRDTEEYSRNIRTKCSQQPRSTPSYFKSKIKKESRIK